MPLPSTRRTFLLLWSLVTGAFIAAAMVLIHVTGSATSSTNVSSTRDSAIQGTAEYPAGAAAKSAATDEASRISVHPNPAAQRAGPPDPAMQSNAVAAAENAAKAAADLAEK